MKLDHTHLGDFSDTVFVACPKCEEKARVKKEQPKKEGRQGRVRFSCVHCGLNKKWKGNTGIVATGNLKLGKNAVHHGGVTDPYFGFSLWYQASCCGNVLWAYNEEHLEFYREYIGDKLRERKQNEHGWSNRSLQSRLPKWMLSGSNRQEILKKIDQLLDNSFRP